MKARDVLCMALVSFSPAQKPDYQKMGLVDLNDSQRTTAQESLPLRELALIHVVLAYETDQDLDPSEMETTVVCLSQWVPDADEHDIRRAIREAMNSYVHGKDERLFADAVNTVDRSISNKQKANLLADLRRTAAADEKTLDSERRMVRDLADAWGLDAE